MTERLLVCLPARGHRLLEGLISHGASPRATLGLVTASRAPALLRGRGVSPALTVEEERAS